MPQPTGNDGREGSGLRKGGKTYTKSRNETLGKVVEDKAKRLVQVENCLAKVREVLRVGDDFPNDNLPKECQALLDKLPTETGGQRQFGALGPRNQVSELKRLLSDHFSNREGCKTRQTTEWVCDLLQEHKDLEASLEATLFEQLQAKKQLGATEEGKAEGKLCDYKVKVAANALRLAWVPQTKEEVVVLLSNKKT